VRAKRVALGFNWLGVAVIVAVLGIWQLLVSSRALDYSSLPAPSQIASGLGYLASHGSNIVSAGMWSDLGHTVRCVLEAWAFALLIGGLGGLLIGLNPTVASWASATIDMFRSLPIIALIPIAILIWGPGSKAEVILGAYAAVWPMLVNTTGGVRSVPPQLRDVARTLRLSRWQTLIKVVMPATGAAMLVGARLALTVALVVCVVAEMLGLQTGIGNAILLEQSADEPARMWAYVLIVGVLGIIANAGLVRAVRLVFPGVSAVSERRSS
jgi:ABC-type nitrate/sulfonate/bicarbonate transport system permease component